MSGGLGNRDLGRAGVVSLLALALDQISKSLVRSEISPGESVDLFLGIDLVRVGNEGIAFGLLESTGSLVIVVAALAFVVLLGYFLRIGRRPWLWLPIGLLAGGALGNLLDRLREGAVTDFIDLPRWPAFNIADIEITVGILVLVVIFLREEAGGESETGEPPVTDEAQG